MLTGLFRYPHTERVIYGRPFADALTQEMEEAPAERIFMLASGTLARETDTLDLIRRVLGARFAGMHSRIGAHTPRNDCLDAANGARAANADLLLTIGGGSVTDAAKIVGLCLGNGITTPNS